MKEWKNETYESHVSPVVFIDEGGVCSPIELGPGLDSLRGLGGVGIPARTPW